MIKFTKEQVFELIRTIKGLAHEDCDMCLYINGFEYYFSFWLDGNLNAFYVSHEEEKDSRINLINMVKEDYCSCPIGFREFIIKDIELKWNYFKLGGKDD